MGQKTQLERYKKLLSFIDKNLKEDINIEKIEAICHYSYRNINRIFTALHHETIGKYIKRLRLEKAAQYLKYSDMNVADISFEVGFKERAAFSKAFKKKYGCAPSAFRTSIEADREDIQQSLLTEEEAFRQKLEFEVAFLPKFEYLFLEYRGDYKDLPAIEKVWNQLTDYLTSKDALTDRSIFMTEIMDDNEISDHLNSRYHFASILDGPIKFELEGLFRTKTHNPQKYAKFIHKGSHESSFDFYNKIYAYWMLDVGLELKDLPVLEFYHEYDENIPPDEILTEIYIPVK